MKNKFYINIFFFILINILFFLPEIPPTLSLPGPLSWGRGALLALSEAKKGGGMFLPLLEDARGAGNRIVAIVNDEVITENEMEDSNKSISSLIEKKLQVQVAKKTGISVQDSEELAILKLINKEINSKIIVSDKEVEDYYSSNRQLFSLPDEVRIGYIHIPVKTSDSVESIQEIQKRMNNILLDLKDNVPFSDIKKRYPEVLVSEDLGYVKKGNLVKDLDNATFTMEEGEISDVIYTPAGFYIIKIFEKKKLEYRPLHDVKDLVIDGLLKEKSEKLYREWLYKIKSTSYIEIKI